MARPKRLVLGLGNRLVGEDGCCRTTDESGAIRSTESGQKPRLPSRKWSTQ
jgi:hypothetical protein